MTWFTDYAVMIYESLGDFSNVFLVSFFVTVFIFSLLVGVLRKL